ncbi:MAG: MraY family glycosyltransferase [bacterium]
MSMVVPFFLISAVISVLITPYVKKVGHKIGALDFPEARKIHNGVIPRCGGIVIYLGFFLPFLFSFISQNGIFKSFQLNKKIVGFAVGGSLIMLVGLLDDIKGLKAYTKFIAQIFIAIFVYWCGFRIDKIIFPYFGIIEFSNLSLPISTLWFLMVINAINLIDGLDGLAVGVSLFASIVLAIISVIRHEYLGFLIFSSFSGTLVGFLPYNFNPASIFLGDSGSYFIGFVLAALGLGTSQKSSMTVAILTPIIALGLPLMDMIWATIRRFIFGNKIFAPDKEHLHHKLIQLGFSTRAAVLLLYAVTIVFGALSLIIVNTTDVRLGLVLSTITIVSMIMIVMIRKLGYTKYFPHKKMRDWVAGISDEAGISRDRRHFLSQQVAILESENIHQFWSRLISIGEKIDLSAISLSLNSKCFCCHFLPKLEWKKNDFSDRRIIKKNGNNNYIYVEFSIISNEKYYGVLRFKKNFKSNGNGQNVLKRIESLRPNIAITLERLAKESFSDSKVLRIVDDKGCGMDRLISMQTKKGNIEYTSKL